MRTLEFGEGAASSMTQKSCHRPAKGCSRPSLESISIVVLTKNKGKFSETRTHGPIGKP